MKKIPGEICTIPWCERTRAKSRGQYCSFHKKLRYRHAIEGTVISKPLMFGAPCISKAGYVIIRFFGKHVKVHRLVDVITNGPLPAGYIVHHKDGNKLNNHWDNLQRIKSQQEHLALHRKEI